MSSELIRKARLNVLQGYVEAALNHDIDIDFLDNVQLSECPDEEIIKLTRIIRDLVIHLDP